PDQEGQEGRGFTDQEVIVIQGRQERRRKPAFLLPGFPLSQERREPRAFRHLLRDQTLAASAAPAIPGASPNPGVQRFRRVGSSRLPNNSPAISASRMLITASAACWPAAKSCCWIRVSTPRTLELPGTIRMMPGTRTSAPGRWLQRA